MHRTRTEFVLLIVLTICCIGALYTNSHLAWGESPLSPFSPIYPNTTLAPQVHIPLFAEPPLQSTPALPRPSTTVQNWFGGSPLASPWTWFIIGLVLFGGIAYGWLKLAHRSARVNDKP